MFTQRARLLWLVFGVSDLILLAISFEVAYVIRSHINALPLFYMTPGGALGLLTIAAAVWPVTGAFLGVYRRLEGLTDRRIFRSAILQSFSLAVGLPTAIVALKLGDPSRAFLG